ncbi:hypothetical protein K3495_g15627 [Podosphaera aphanis]|nr:hypothetical protein K3495_g15627 [Podosphaera aphanis]
MAFKIHCKIEETTIRSPTAQNWLKKMGFTFSNIKKDVYIDGHKREDVDKYHGSRKEPLDLQLNEKPLVFVTHDESIFNANDGKLQMWINRDSQPLRPKEKEKGIMASNFLTPGGILKVPHTVPDEELVTEASFPRDESGKPLYSWNMAKTITGLRKISRANHESSDSHL